MITGRKAHQRASPASVRNMQLRQKKAQLFESRNEGQSGFPEHSRWGEPGLS